MELGIFVGSLFLFMFFGIPIAFILILCSIVLMIYMGVFDPSIISQQMVMGTNNFSLMAIPFFMLAGEIMAKGGLSRRIVNFANIIVGKLKGGLGYAAILASIIFSGLSGSAVADAAALGAILIPMMYANGYSPERSTGLICAGAMVAPIIPPSIPMIVLGSTVGVSITKMFMAGIVPGLLLGLGLMIAWKVIVKKHGYNDVCTYTKKEQKEIIKDSLPALVMPIIIVGGIRFGIFTPTEAGSFAVIYALLVSILWYKEIKPRDVIGICVDSAGSTAIVMFIVAGATAVGWLITVAQIPNQLAAVLGGMINHPLALMIIINIFLFAMGMVMDLTPNLLIFGPVLFPVIIQAGIDPIYFAVVMVLNLCLGLITPPVGTVLYLGCSVGKITFPQVVKGIMPFLLVEVLVLALLIIFPQLVLVPLKFLI